MPAVDLGERARQQQTQPQQDENAITEAETAFLIYRDKKTGQVILTDNINLALITERKLTAEEMLMQMFIASESIKAQKTAEMAAGAFMQMNMAIAQQMQAQQQVAGLGDLRG